MGAELSHAEGQAEAQTQRKQTDMSKLVAAFCDFAYAPKNKRSCENAIYTVVILLITEKFGKAWRE